MESNVEPRDQPDSQLTGTSTAPILAPALSHDVLEVFARPAHITKAYDGEDRITYVINDRNRPAESYPAEVCVTRTKQDGEQAKIKVNCTPKIGSGVAVSVSGLESDWCLTQKVDDGNLLTELVYQDDAILSVYGPPASEGATGININGSKGQNLLIPPQLRNNQ